MVGGLKNVRQLVSGREHTLVILTDGTVKAWGGNQSAQLGLGETENVMTPKTISQLTGVKQIAAGNDYTFALMEDGTVRAWGDNYYGQLGMGDYTNRIITIPTVVPGLSGVKQVALSYNSSRSAFALMEDGTVKAWGDNEYGELGLGDISVAPSPTTIPGLRGVRQLAVGPAHTLALMEDGTVKAWGFNYQGQLGLGNENNIFTPTTIPGLSGVKQLIAGPNNSFALMEDGTIKAWGKNEYGELGLGDTTDRMTPTLIGINGVRQLAAG
ncbi:RCC1 repeat-containing protein, partial [Paenibacillus elgii]